MTNKQSSIKVRDLKTRKDAKGGELTKTDPYTSSKDAYYSNLLGGTTTTSTTKTTKDPYSTAPTDPSFTK
jgi:hypothetical protein